MFYDEFINLCASRGISKQKACIDCGISRTAWNKWRNGGLPNGATIGRLAEYFGVTSDFLLGGTETEKAPTPGGERQPSDDEIKFALFGGSGDITDAMYDEVKNFAAYVKQREEEKKKKG